MSEYVKPEIKIIVLRPEELLATAPTSMIPGGGGGEG